MPVSSETSISGPYYPNGSTKSFPFDFKATAANEVVALDQDGVTISPALYSVTLAQPAGGTLTFGTAPELADYTAIYVVSDPALTQPSDFDNAGPSYNPAALTRALDRAAARDLKQQRDLDRGLKMPFGESAPPMPSIDNLKGKFTAVDLEGNFYGSFGTGSDGGLREDLAEGPALALIKGAPGFASARAELDDKASLAQLATKAPVSTKSPAARAALYPVEMRLGADAQPHPFEYITNNATRNAIRAGTSTTDVSAELQAMLDDWQPSLGGAGIIEFPKGCYALAAPLQFPSWVGFRGFGRGTQLLALPGHVGPYMFQFDSDPDKVLNGPPPVVPKSYFNSFLEGFDINANAQAGIEWVIYAPSWNEKCGLRDVMARDVENGFLFIDEWHGGSSGFLINNLEVFATANAYDNSKTVIRLRGKNRAGVLIGNRPTVTMSGVTIAGAKAGEDGDSAGLTMIEVDNINLDVKGSMHFERTLQGILVKNGGNVSDGRLSGSDDGGRVVDLIVRDSDHTGQIDIDLSEGTGTVHALRDYRAGAPGSIVTTRTVGGRLTVPSRPGQSFADGVFAVGGGAITSSTLRGCSSVTRVSAGYYEVTLSDNFPTGANNDNYHVVAEAHDDIPCYVHAPRSERTAGTFRLRAQGQNNNSLADPVQVSFRVYRKPGL